MKIFVTGGLGYIGSHTSVALLNSGHNVVILDNLSNSDKSTFEKIKQITNKSFSFYEGDIGDRKLVGKILHTFNPDHVIHFASLKSVADSISMKKKYYDNNVLGSKNLFNEMEKNNVNSIIFSSSATVYGNTTQVPINELSPLAPINPYGENKVSIEKLLIEKHNKKNWNICILRYFNPAGTHSSNLLGEKITKNSANLMPNICKSLLSKNLKLLVYGNDYDTPDGTGIRDYIHINDLVVGHLQAIKYVASNNSKINILNLGTGVGYSVLEMINTFESISNKKLNYSIVDKRVGDVAISIADPALANEALNWNAKFSLEDMCRDTWNKFLYEHELRK